MNVRNKLILSFIIVVFVPVLIVGIYLTLELRQMAIKDTIDQTTTNIERVKLRTAEVLTAPIYVSHNLSFDNQLKTIVNKQYETIYDVVEQYQSYHNFENYRRVYNHISGFRFYMENPTMLNNWEFIPLTDEIKNKYWYGSAEEGFGLIGWYFIEDETKGNRKYLSLVRRINFLDYKTSGMLVISIKTEYLNRILAQESFPMMIIDEQNHVIAANRANLFDKKLNDITLEPNTIDGHTGTFEGIVDGEPSQIIVDDLELEMSLNELKIVSVIPNASIVKHANRLSIVGTTVISISVGIAFILIYFLSKLISNRLLRLKNQISKVSAGNFKTSLVVDGNDEIGQLSNHFNLMVDNIQRLIDEVHITNEQKNSLEIKQNEIKLKMMASQINPHFLFNALESIRMKAHIKGEKEISQVVKLLGKLMRKSIEVSGRKVPLKDEIEMVRCYLLIQQFRYEDRLEFDLLIDPLSEDIQIPPLIIQPLVENAVIHGLEGKEHGGGITVETQVLSNNVIIKVRDNGCGIPINKQEEIYLSLDNSDEKEGNRIGLRNVHHRLQLLYGVDHGLSFDSELNVGTTVFFSIPRREE